ncbi:Molybdenum cofactor biosynthesis MoeB [Penicillium taxi]|uniref:Molybdenum cofactor biosynthesis MoeB n=1 Tax=Penicillium taxi TaxID=168475 RepID=UPI0025453AA3|nr:Molybdenum cofactor biosynthesis MoeB [Penicillium taxi]KAJ5908150.1 Molybdenum cofactor biosynthesis MoeB [Penicillium taxi]
MSPSGSKWWQAPAEEDLDYGFDSDEMDARFAESQRNRSHPTPTPDLREREDFQETSEGGVFGNMSSWLHRQAGSQNNQFATTAVLSGAAVAGAIFGYQAYKRKEAVHDLKASIPEIGEKHVAEKLTSLGIADKGIPLSKEDERSAALARRAQQGDYDDDLILEQLARNRVFLKNEGLAKLRSSFIIVVGCGGVGSHAAAALARSGVGKIRLIDFDQVSLSSLNRHAVATLADVGTPKVHCIRRRLEQIAPWVTFDCRNELFGKEAAETLLGPWTLTHDGESRRPDYVLDCIDNIISKVDLLYYCHSNSLPVISSMGAACKSDPTRVTVGDISLTTDDPLSRSTRHRLKALGVSSGVAAVFSTERPGSGKASLLPLPEEEYAKGQVGELGVLPDFRVRILPVLGTMPAVFGYTVANHVICNVAGYPIDYNMGAKGHNKLYEGIMSYLKTFSEKLAREVAGENTVGLRIPITKDDIAFLMEEVWRGKSVITGLSSRLVLTLWQVPERGFGMNRTWEEDGQKFVPLELKELVCMTKEEAANHEREVLRGGKKVEEVYDETVLKRSWTNTKNHELDDTNNFYHASHAQPSPSRFSQFPGPLVDAARNGWQSSSSYVYQSLTNDTSKHPQWLQIALSIIAAPRFRRYVVVYLTLFLVGWASWAYVLYPRIQEHSSLLHSLDPATMTEKGGWFGTNSLPEFDDLVRLRTLDSGLLPTARLEGEDPGSRKEKRLIVIGDVHGCKEELVNLLKKVAFAPKGGDHLVFTGDLINKGPDSAGVVDLAREYKASCVRGNHEDRVLLVRHEMSKAKTLVEADDPQHNFFSSKDIQERELALSLSEEHIQWLDQCPVILDLGSIQGMGQAVVVHGGIVPGVKLEHQDPSSVMNMRTIDLDTHVPSSSDTGMNWAKMFNKYQSILYSSVKSAKMDPLSHVMTVIYGHDAKTSLKIRTYTKGLDSGCVKGGKLTALIIEAGGQQTIVQVKCQNYLKETKA